MSILYISLVEIENLVECRVTSSPVIAFLSYQLSQATMYDCNWIKVCNTR